MALLCAGVRAFVLLFRANRLLVSAKSRAGTHQHQVCCRFALAARIPARALGAAVVRRFLPDGCCRARWSARLRPFRAIVWHAPTSGRVPSGLVETRFPSQRLQRSRRLTLGTAMVSGRRRR
jgi:hypothetical protein